MVSNNKIWQGALALSLASLFAKVLSVLYRIPYQNITGDIGLYIYQQVYPIYGTIMLVSTYGFPLVISKLIAEYPQKIDTQKIIKVSFLSLAIVSALCTSVAFFGAKPLARFMGDESLYLPLRTVAFLFLFVPFLAVMRGYFQGNQNMIPTAISQITEQIIRAISIVILSYMLIGHGYSYYVSGAGAFFGSLLGAVAAVMVLFLYRKKSRVKANHDSKIPTRFIVKEIFLLGFFICVSQLFLILLQFIDALSIKSMLSAIGMKETEAMTAKGVYDRGFPLIQLGITIATAFSVSLVPLVAKMKTWNELYIAEKKSELAFIYRLSIIVSTGATIGLISIMKPTNIMLFKDSNGTAALSILAISILCLSSILTSSAVLQGLGKIHISALHIGIGLFTKLILNLLLIPYFSITGAAVATVIACAVTAMLNEIALKRHLTLQKFQRNQWIKIFLSVATMAMLLATYNYVLEMIGWSRESRLYFTFQAISSVLLGGYIYVYSLLQLGVITKEEVSTLPYQKMIQMVFRLK